MNIFLNQTNSSNSRPYPKLQEDSAGTIWWMFSKKEGVYIYNKTGYTNPPFINTHMVATEEFKDFLGTVTLEEK